MPKVPDSEFPLPAEVSSTTLADLLGISSRYVNMLAADGKLVKAGPGRFKLRESILAYVRAQSAEGQAEAADTDRAKEELLKLRAEREITQLKARKLAGVLVESRRVARRWSDLIITAKTKLLALPARLAPQVVVAPSIKEAERLIDREIMSALEELSRVRASDYSAPDPDLEGADLDEGAEPSAPVSAKS